MIAVLKYRSAWKGDGVAGIGPVASFRMRLAFCALVLFAGVFSPCRAAEPQMHLSSKKVRAEVRAVVEAQLAALREEDFEAAYALASSAIKEQFDVRLFAALIRRGYPTLLQPADVDVGAVRDKDGETAQATVSLVTRQKRTVVYTYLLVREKSGWLINGVILEQRPSAGNI